MLNRPWLWERGVRFAERIPSVSTTSWNILERMKHLQQVANEWRARSATNASICMGGKWALTRNRVFDLRNSSELADFVFFHICQSKFSFRVDLYGTWSHGHSNVINMKVASIATPHLLRPRAASRPGEVLVLSLDDQPNLKLMDSWTALGKLHLFRIFGE